MHLICNFCSLKTVILYTHTCTSIFQGKVRIGNVSMHANFKYKKQQQSLSMHTICCTVTHCLHNSRQSMPKIDPNDSVLSVNVK